MHGGTLSTSIISGQHFAALYYQVFVANHTRHF